MTNGQVSTDPELGDPLASIGQRIAARVIDWGLLLMIWLLLGGATSQRLEDDSLQFARWAVIVWMALVVIYEAGLVALDGQTLGKRVVGIEIVSLKTGGRLSFAASLTRVMPVGVAIALLGSFFPVVIVFVYFSAAFRHDTRGMLDHMAGSVVIKRSQHRPGT